MGRTGLTEWEDSGDYWSWTAGNPGTLTLLRGGEGYIRGKEVYFDAGQTINIAYNERTYVYINDAGVLSKSATNSLADKKEHINLFIALNDAAGNFILIKNEHNYSMDIGSREWIDTAHGTTVGTEGSILTRFGTGTGASATDRKVNISSGSVLDADINETWSAITSGITINHTYINTSNQQVRHSLSDEFPMLYNLNGTPTPITVNSYAIYRVYVTKSSANSASPQFISEMNSAQYSTTTAVNTAVANNTATNFGRFDADIAQIAQVVVRNTATGGHVVSITVAKKTIGAVIGSSGVGSTASAVTTTS
jgi:hypothetical protein